MKLGFTHVLLIACIASLGACGGSDKSAALSYGDNAKRAYMAAMQDFQDEDCLEAEEAFRDVSRNYPYSRYAALAELRVADCMVMQAKFAEGISEYEEFIRRRPTHSEVAYARYKISETYFRQMPEDWVLSPPSHERDQQETRKALSHLQRFVVQHSKDGHLPEARKMIQKSLFLLARHELYVAEYYLDRDEPQAAIVRLEGILKGYRGSGLEPRAFVLLGRTYLHLGQRKQAERAFTDVIHAYPKSPYALQAQSYLSSMSRTR